MPSVCLRLLMRRSRARIGAWSLFRGGWRCRFTQANGRGRGSRQTGLAIEGYRNMKPADSRKAEGRSEQSDRLVCCSRKFASAIRGRRSGSRIQRGGFGRQKVGL